MKKGFDLECHSSIKIVFYNFENNNDEGNIDYFPLLWHPGLVEMSTFQRMTVLID